MTKVLKLALMGRLQIEQEDASLTELVSAKAQALLCYLAVTGQPHSRQSLAGLLWGDMPEADARRNLRGVVMKLRQLVAPHLHITYQTLAFNGDSSYWLDVELFRRDIPFHAGEDPAPARLGKAVALYRGDFLEDFYIRQAPAFDEWVANQRLQLQELALNAYQALAVYYTEQGDYVTGIEVARRLLQFDPVREDTQQQLMLLLTLNGQRSAALAQYEVCCRILAAELGVTPAAETVALYERIRHGQVSEGRPVAIDRPVRPAMISPVPRMVMPPVALEQTEPSPFIAGPPITYPGHFFGRERELKRLFNLFKRLPLQNAALIGPRRSGKTSLLHYLKNITTADPQQLRPNQYQEWLPQPEQVHWIFVDFQDPRLGHCAGLLEYWLTEMGLPTADPCDMDYFLDVVTEHLHMPTIILFDEIGVALQRYTELDDAFWESLRSLATNQVGGNLGFVLAAAERPETLAQNSGLGSPFFNIFGYTATLGPLSEPAARELIASSPLPFAEADVAWILAESERWPFLLQILCRERLLALEDGEEGDGWREDARRQMRPFVSLKENA